MRRLFPIGLAMLWALAACGSSDTTTPPTVTASTPAPASTTAPSPASSVTGSASAKPPLSPAPDLPAGVPPLFEGDVGAANVPAAALVPLKTEVTGTWYGATSRGEAIVVAWQVPGDDPFHLARGLAVWRRFDDDGAPWRPVYATTWPAKVGVLAVTVLPAEVTGDGSDDALVQIETGGSGGCARWLVVDLAGGEVIWDDEGCDRRIEPHAGPTGLLVTEAVYEQGDPHCCPSASRETVWTYVGDGSWDEASERVVPTG